MRFLIVIIWSLLFTSIQAQNGWTAKAGIPVRRDQAAAFTIGNYGYVGTGVTPSFPHNDFWRYDPLMDTWIEIDSMPTLGRRGAFSFAIGNKGYVGGGVNSRSLTDDEFWEYDSDRSTWSRKADMPSGLTYSAETLIGFSIGEYGYLYAPFNRFNFYRYDPITDTWSTMENSPMPKGLDQIGFSIGGKGYVGSGSGLSTTNLTEFWEYDAQLNQWSRKADLPGQDRFDAVGFSVGNYGYFGLGRHRTNLLFDFWEYHPTTDTWVQIDSCHYAALYALGIGIGSKGYIGTGIKFSSDSGWWEYTPTISNADDIEESTSVSVYPNPASNHIHIDTKKPGLLTLSVYTIMGQLVKSAQIVDPIISVDDLPVGVYILQIQAEKQQTSIKLIKE